MHVLPNIGSAHPGTVPEFSYTRSTYPLIIFNLSVDSIAFHVT